MENTNSDKNNLAIIESKDQKKTKDKKKRPRLLQNVEMAEQVKLTDNDKKKLSKKTKFFFSYERLDSKPTQPRDYRLELQKIIVKKYNKLPVKKIPFETEINLRFGFQYKVYFENKDELKEFDKDLKFEAKKFQWCKFIEDQEIGYTDEY